MITKKDYQVKSITNQIKEKAIELFHLRGEFPQFLSFNLDFYEKNESALRDELTIFFNDCFYGMTKDEEPFCYLEGDFFTFHYELDGQRFIYSIDKLKESENIEDLNGSFCQVSFPYKLKTNELDINMIKNDENENENNEYNHYEHDEEDFTENDEWFEEESKNDGLIELLRMLVFQNGYKNLEEFSKDYSLKKKTSSYEIYRLLKGEMLPSNKLLESFSDFLNLDLETKCLIKELKQSKESKNEVKQNFYDNNLLNQVSNYLYEKSDQNIEDYLNKVNCETANNNYNFQDSENDVVKKYRKNKGSYYYDNLFGCKK